MIIVTLRTDNPDAEIGLYDDEKQLAYETWQAHRKLAETIHRKLQDLLSSCDKDWQDIEGIVCFQGPGSFTGLRIGLTVGNALAYGLQIPIIATQNPSWIATGIKQPQGGTADPVALPLYGSPAHVTEQKK